MRKLKFGFREYLLKLIPNLEGNKTKANIDYYNCTVEVNKTDNYQTQWQAVFHEMIHAALFDLGLFKKEHHDEDMIEGIATAMCMLLVQNPQMATPQRFKKWMS